jgi:hypothetical protein
VPETIDCDLAVYGATPGGILAAVTAARYGRRVTLCAAHDHVGGLLSSGLSIANIRYLQAHSGPFAAFARAVEAHYVAAYGPDGVQVRECRGGTWWEPHVAEAVFEALLAAAPGVRLLRGVRLAAARTASGRVVGFAVRDRAGGALVEVRAPVSVDATYEADLAAAAGVPYRVGREGREEHWEPHAGMILSATRNDAIYPGSTGAGDRRLQAYCYRLCVTRRPEIRVPFPAPSDYRRADYAPVLRAFREGRVRRLLDVMHLGPERLRVNGKADVILNVPGAADAWPEADEAGREAIARRHREYSLGLFYLLQHDDAAPVPAAVREEARSWGLAADEFVDNGHWPYELYVREARRIAGRATATEHDFLREPGAERAPLHADAIAVADYVLDSHAMRYWPEAPYEEGHLNLSATHPGQVRYGCLIPVDAGGAAVAGLLVPVAVSATHLGFAAIRMEPVWMALGAAAGTAAHLALLADTLPDALPVERLQAELARHDHRLGFFHDVPLDAHRPGTQFFAPHGFFDSAYARPEEAVSRSEAVRWLGRCLDLAGVAPVAAGAAAGYPDVPAGHADAAAVERLQRLGIVDGWLESAAFCPAASLRRCDAERWLSRLAALLAKGAGPAPPAPPVLPTPERPYAPLGRAALCDALFGLLYPPPRPAAVA